MQKYKFSDDINNQLLKFQRTDNYHWILGLGYDYLIMFFAVLISIKLSAYFYPVSILIIASRMRALATLLHDAAHLRLCKNRYLNNFVGKYLTGLLILQGFNSYIKTHVVKHHLFLGNETHDPDYQYYISSGLYSNITKVMFIKKYIVYPLLILNTISFIKYLLKNRLFNNKMESFLLCFLWTVIIELFVSFAILKYLILFWVVPLLFIFPIFGWFIEISEHYPIIAQANIDLHASRNRRTGFIEWFLFGVHNESYHLTHHLKPGIPYWNLVKAHRIMLQDKCYYNINQSNASIFLTIGTSDSILKQMVNNFK